MGKVYCEKCEHYDEYAHLDSYYHGYPEFRFEGYMDTCKHPNNFIIVDTAVKPQLKNRWWGVIKNKNNDCELFEPKEKSDFSIITYLYNWWRNK
ncbi:MAG: hypothetical protein ACXADW_16640 [Candidatus Hodarchaeales archaeon]|jgi:hypothetical protein